MFDLLRDQSAIVAFKGSRENRNTTSELNENLRNILGHRLDFFLESACRTQNAIIPYLRRFFPEIQFNKSFRDVVKKLNNGLISLPKEFSDSILEYWNVSGVRLRDYRDLCQHYSIVSTAAKVVVPETGEPALLFCLPNNPEVDSPAKLLYDDPQVHVQGYVLKEFFNLLEFCYSTLERMLDPQTDAALVPGFEGSSPMTRAGTGCGTMAYIPVDVASIETAVKDALNELGARFPASQRM
jgi:hypothetical protein